MSVWGHHGRHGGWIHDGVNLTYDAAQRLVKLMMGRRIVDVMSVDEYEAYFGTSALLEVTGKR